MTLTDQLAQELPPSGRYASTEAFLAAFPVSDKVKQVAAKIINSGQVEQAQAAIAALQRHEAAGALLTVDALAEAAAAAGVVPEGLARLAVEDWLEETGRTVDPLTGEIIEPAADAATRVADAEPEPEPKTKRGQLPDAVLDKFRQRRGETDAHYWGLGDDVADAVVEFAGKITQQKIIKAAALETDLSNGEVRLLFETARAFDQSLRDEFADILTHMHFRVLRYIDDRSQQKAYLTWCIESADAYGGRPAPAAVLARKVQKDRGIEPPAPTKAELIDRAVRAIERVRDISENEREHDALVRMVATLEKMLNKS